jgi:hypothetical protein
VGPLLGLLQVVPGPADNDVLLEGQVFIEYMLNIEGFEGVDLTGKGGLVVWTGEGRPATSSLIAPNAENCITLKNMYWSEQFEKWTVRTPGINAKEYGDMIYMRPFVEIKEGEYITGSAAWYSVKTYCDDKLSKNTDKKLQEVCASILEYGAAAQQYFDYKEDALVNEGLDVSAYNLEFSEEMLDALKPAGPKTASLSGTKEKVGSAKATLSLEGSIVLEVVYPSVEIAAEDILKAEVLVWTEEAYNSTEDFSYAGQTYTFKVPMKLGELAGSEGYTASLKLEGTYEGIPAKSTGDTLYFAAYVETTEGIYRSGMSVYSPDYFVKQMLGSSNAELVRVAKALAVYGEKARAIFG